MSETCSPACRTSAATSCRASAPAEPIRRLRARSGVLSFQRYQICGEIVNVCIGQFRQQSPVCRQLVLGEDFDLTSGIVVVFSACIDKRDVEIVQRSNNAFKRFSSGNLDFDSLRAGRSRPQKACLDQWNLRELLSDGGKVAGGV